MIPVLSRSSARRRPAASAFSPADVAGLQLWLAADAIAGLSDGDPVGTWADSSGGGRDGTAGGANRPAYRTNVVNGKPVVRFDGTDDRLAVAASFEALTAGHLFAVVKIDADPPGDVAQTGFLSFGADSNFHFPFVDGNIYDNFGTLVRKDAISHAGQPLSQWRVYEAASVPGSWTNWLDGTQLRTTATNAVGWVTQAETFVGCNRFGGTGAAGQNFFLDGDLAELIVYGSVLSGDDQAAVRSYLSGKYAL